MAYEVAPTKQHHEVTSRSNIDYETASTIRGNVLYEKFYTRGVIQKKSYTKNIIQNELYGRSYTKEGRERECVCVCKCD